MSDQPGIKERIATLEAQTKTLFVRVRNVAAIQWAMIVGIGASQFAIILKLWSV